MPTYSDLFRDPPRTDRLTQADLANLGRLAALEAISMFEHARSEFPNSPASPQLLAEIEDVWRAADDFTASIAYSEDREGGLESGRLTYPAMERAFVRLRDRMDNLAGAGQSRTRLDFLRMTRIVAVIPPLLAAEAPRAAAGIGTDSARIDETARVLASQVRSLRAVLESRTAVPDRLRRDVDRLRDLADGLARLAAPGTEDAVILAGLRPLNLVASSVGLELSQSIRDATVEDRWRRARRTIDSLSARFQLSREIVLSRPRENTPLERAIPSIDAGIRQLDALIGDITEGGRRPTGVELPIGAARTLRSRLLLLRQDAIAGRPTAEISRDLDLVEAARDPLRPAAVGQSGRAEARSLDEALTKASELVRESLRSGGEERPGVTPKPSAPAPSSGPPSPRGRP